MQKGGSQYGVPPSELPPFSTASTSRPAEATSPAPARQPNFEEMAAGAGFHEDDLLGGGEDADRGGVSGNRWPRQETLALLKIRSDMDATFREASLKGPLWEEVSRKLAEQGYTRSAKKCKEKFENVHKYYKRTKDSRAARPDGKSYRFFSQLEALHSASSSSPAAAAAAAPAAVTAAAPAAAMPVPSGAKIQQPTPISSIPPPQNQSAVPPVAAVESGAAVAAAVGLSGFGGGGASFSSNTSESETEDEESEEGAREQRKRKREEGGEARGGGGSRSMMAFFDELMKQVMERQEAMQKKFLETIEKREQDRMIREEAWRRQEMARLSLEQEAVTHERTVAASRDATIISFLQKITGQTVQLPHSVPPPVPSQTQQPAAPVAPAAPPPPPPSAPTPPPAQPQPQPQVQQLQPPPPHVHQTLAPPPAEIVPSTMHEHSQQIHEAEAHPGSTSDPASSRWPKTEVHALINIRAGMESRYQEAGPKGPLWEEISAAMKQIGYNRNAKRCKEKWENINKYFKKVKESNKKRPEDAKTCPYFHQLDALYRSKVLGGFGTAGGDHGQARIQQQDPDPTVLPITTLPPPSNGSDNSTSKTLLSPMGGATQAAPNSNGSLSALRFTADAAPTDIPMKKPEDIVKELMDRRQQHQQYDYDRMDDDTDDDDDDEDDDMMDEEEQKMAYKIEFQRPTMPPTSTSNVNGNKSSRSAGSFLAMVHQ